MSEITAKHADATEAMGRMLHDVSQNMRTGMDTQFLTGQLIDVRREVNRIIQECMSAHYRSLPTELPTVNLKELTPEKATELRAFLDKRFGPGMSGQIGTLNRDNVLSAAQKIHDESGCQCDPRYIMSCARMGPAILEVGRRSRAAEQQVT